MSVVIAALYSELQRHAVEIEEQFKRRPKVTIVVRCPWLDDADVVFTSDEPHEAIAAIERLADTAEAGRDR